MEGYYGKYKGIEIYHISAKDYIEEVLLKNDTTNRMYVIDDTILYRGKVFGILDVERRELHQANIKENQYVFLGDYLVEALRLERKKVKEAQNRSVGQTRTNTRKKEKAKAVLDTAVGETLAEQMLASVETNTVENLVEVEMPTEE